MLLAVGYLASPPGAAPLIAIVNRCIGFVVIWFLAVVIYRYVVAQIAIQRLMWVQQAQVRIHQEVRSAQSAGNVGDALVRALAHALDAHVGVVYQCVDGRLHRLATWAMADADRAPATLAAGETLAGQAVTENRVIAVGGLPPDYLPVASALGRASPTEIVAAPLTAEGEVVGVIELGFITSRRGTADVVELLDRVGEPVGMTLRAASYRGRLEHLLGETQRQSEELQVQQEELRVSNEELEERGRALMDSQARLETQQAELEQTNVQLEEHTQRLETQKREMLAFQAELAANARALERSNQYKSEFLANMSHELRTPLNSALILAKLLQENKDGTLSDEQVRYAATIHAANTDLLNLINDILDLSKIEAGHLTIEPEPVELDAFTARISQLFDHVGEQKGVAFRVERMPGLPDAIVTDSQRLQQILKNLLSNAFKFTERDRSRWRWSRRATMQSASRCATPASAFRATSSRSSSKPSSRPTAPPAAATRGTGLGLSISRELARLLGGAIAVASEPGQGSVFSLTVPRTLVADAATQAGLVTPPGAPERVPAPPSQAMPMSSVARAAPVPAPEASEAAAGPIAIRLSPADCRRPRPSHARQPPDPGRGRRYRLRRHPLRSGPRARFRLHPRHHVEPGAGAGAPPPALRHPARSWRCRTSRA